MPSKETSASASAKSTDCKPHTRVGPALHQKQVETQSQGTEIRRRPYRTSVKARHRRSSGHAPAQMTEELQSPVISLRQIHGLSSQIASKWRQVAYCLKPQPMERCEVDEITTQYPGNLQEQAMEMLQRWKDRDGHTVTVDVTCEVLITASYKAEAEEVFGVNAVQKVHSQMTDSDSENPDRLLIELAEEVGVFWKELATDAGFRIHKIKVIEKEARTPKEQALEMLLQLRSKMGHSNFSVDEVRARNCRIQFRCPGSGQAVTESRSNAAVDGPVSPQRRVSVAEKVAGSWERLAINLSPSLFDTNLLEVIRRRYPYDSIMQSVTMLEEWEHNSPASCRWLISALCKIGRNDIAVSEFGEALVEFVLVQQQNVD